MNEHLFLSQSKRKVMSMARKNEGIEGGKTIAMLLQPKSNVTAF